MMLTNEEMFISEIASISISRTEASLVRMSYLEPLDFSHNFLF